MQIFSHQVCICPSFADTNIIREGMEVILQWRPSSFIIFIILIIISEGMELILQWIHNLHHTHNHQRGGIEVILRSRLSWDLWIVNYRLGDLCVISDNWAIVQLKLQNITQGVFKFCLRKTIPRPTIKDKAMLKSFIHYSFLLRLLAFKKATLYNIAS